ncbi:hypothetical protein ACLX1H_010978 [Fusarium chlamydosporum]
MAITESDVASAAESIYATGKILHLNANHDTIPSPGQIAIYAEIRQRISPSPLSCGMVVKVKKLQDNAEVPDDLRKAGEIFLKMFDRRAAQQIRQDNGVDAWTEDMEHDFAKDLASGKIEGFLEKLRTVPNFQEDTEEDWDAAENEAYLAAELLKCFNSEVTTYARLKEYQGILIPRFLAAVTLNVSPFDTLLSPQQKELYQPKGVLLQYLQGFSLSTMIEQAPRSSWQSIVDQAIRIVHILGDKDILNTNVRPDNFIIVPKTDMCEVFMIDFGQCRVRRGDETDEEWGRAKWIQDEEGAVGFVMKSKLKK